MRHRGCPSCNWASAQHHATQAQQVPTVYKNRAGGLRHVSIPIRHGRWEVPQPPHPRKITSQGIDAKPLGSASGHTGCVTAGKFWKRRVAASACTAPNLSGASAWCCTVEGIVDCAAALSNAVESVWNHHDRADNTSAECHACLQMEFAALKDLLGLAAKLVVVFAADCFTKCRAL